MAQATAQVRRGPAPEAIEPLLVELLQQADETHQPRQTTWCELQGRGTFEVRLVPTGLGDHLAIAHQTEFAGGAADIDAQDHARACRDPLKPYQARYR